MNVAVAILILTLSALQAPPPNMSAIPAGDFWMGRVHFFLIDEVGWLERDRRDDLPAHRVYIDAFNMDKYETTNEEFARFAAATDASTPWYWVKGAVPKGEERFPVHDVTWFQADAYCKWAGKRLPTEAEWERAARGGLDRQKFSWGDGGLGLSGSDTDTQVSAEATNTKRAHVGSPTGPTTVGSYPPNGFGLHDMTGNVWEWTNDWYDRDYYSVTPDRNPPGPAKGVYKVIRGGGWSDDDDRNLMNHYRNFSDPSRGAPTIGFRCAKN